MQLKQCIALVLQVWLIGMVNKNNNLLALVDRMKVQAMLDNFMPFIAHPEVYHRRKWVLIRVPSVPVSSAHTVQIR